MVFLPVRQVSRRGGPCDGVSGTRTWSARGSRRVSTSSQRLRRRLRPAASLRPGPRPHRRRGRQPAEPAPTRQDYPCLPGTAAAARVRLSSRLRRLQRLGVAEDRPDARIARGRDPRDGADLGSQSTLARFENQVGLAQLGETLARAVIERQKERRKTARLSKLDCDLPAIRRAGVRGCVCATPSTRRIASCRSWAARVSTGNGSRTWRRRCCRMARRGPWLACQCC